MSIRIVSSTAAPRSVDLGRVGHHDGSPGGNEVSPKEEVVGQFEPLTHQALDVMGPVLDLVQAA